MEPVLYKFIIIIIITIIVIIIIICWGGWQDMVNKVKVVDGQTWLIRIMWLMVRYG